MMNWWNNLSQPEQEAFDIVILGAIAIGVRSMSGSWKWGLAAAGAAWLASYIYHQNSGNI